MKIEKNNMSVEVNRPKIQFDANQFTENEIKTFKKKKVLLAATSALTVGAAIASKIYKAKKKK